jgi:glycosyltransferase involved in cell wall biosynthesis
VVAPLYDEEACVGPLVAALREALADAPFDHELILVDDGSRDGTAGAVARAAEADPRVRLVQLTRNVGQTHAMQAGFDAARGRIVVGMDGDLQNDPRDIPRLIEKLDAGFDLVAGYRVRRQDALLSRRLPSRIANRLIYWLTGVSIRDSGCSLKAYRRETLERMHLYADMHRFLPALAASMAGARICEMPVRHHPRIFGTSKYGTGRILRVLADLLTLALLTWFRERPLRLFGFAAAAALAIAVPFGVGAARTWHEPGSGIDFVYVLPTSTLVWITLACHLLLLGLVSEVALRRAREDIDAVLPIVREHGQ